MGKMHAVFAGLEAVFESKMQPFRWAGQAAVRLPPIAPLTTWMMVAHGFAAHIFAANAMARIASAVLIDNHFMVAMLDDGAFVPVLGTDSRANKETT
jgi:hypothetical protein